MADKGTPARGDVTIKFNAIPVAAPVPKDLRHVDIRFVVHDLVFVARVKNKAINKLKKSADEFGSWQGMLSGGLGGPLQGEPSTYRIENAGIQVFERKAKEDKKPKAGAQGKKSPPLPLPAQAASPQRSHALPSPGTVYRSEQFRVSAPSPRG